MAQHLKRFAPCYPLSWPDRVVAAPQVFVNDHRKGQELCLDADIVRYALPQLGCDHTQLKLWLCLALGKCWKDHRAGKRSAVQNNAIEELGMLLTDRVPLVRAAAIYALGQLIGAWAEVDQKASNLIDSSPQVGARLESLHNHRAPVDAEPGAPIR